MRDVYIFYDALHLVNAKVGVCKGHNIALPCRRKTYICIYF